MKDTLSIKWVERKINLDVGDINDVSPLYEAEALEDFQGEHFHEKGFKLNINHVIKTEKYGQIMFIAPNPIEFYLYGAKKSLDKIQQHTPVAKGQLFKNNDLIFEMISFLIYSYSALEALVNYKIPKDTSYEKRLGIFISKEEVEGNLSIEEKIKSVLGIAVGSLEYWPKILNFIKLRHSVTHLKTASEESDFRSYDAVYKELLDFDYEDSFVNIKSLMKEVYE